MPRSCRDFWHRSDTALKASSVAGGYRYPFRKGGESSMCLTCGCLLPHEDHGNPEYLTIEGLERSAALDGYDLDAALQNLIKTVDVAKKETEHDHR